MDYRALDWESYPRRGHFEYFNAMADPYVGLTAEVDVTRFLAVCRGAALFPQLPVLRGAGGQRSAPAAPADRGGQAGGV